MTETHWLLVLGIACIGLLIASVYQFLVIRGFLISTKSIDADYKANRKSLTGTEREELRRRIYVSGISGISAIDVLNLLYTFRLVELGQYTDTDPYIPADPYEDVNDS